MTDPSFASTVDRSGVAVCQASIDSDSRRDAASDPRLADSGGPRPVAPSEVLVEGQGPVPSLLNDRFEVLLWLGTSEWTSDFVGYDRVLRESVVVRIFSASVVGDARRRHELRDLFAKLATSALDAVIPIVDWGRCEVAPGVEPVYFAVTRPPDGPTLRQLVDERGPVPTFRALAIQATVDDLVLDLRHVGVTPVDLRSDSVWLVKGGRLLVDPVDMCLDILFAANCHTSNARGDERRLTVGLRDLQVDGEVEVSAETTTALPQPQARPARRVRRVRELRVPVVSIALVGISWMSLAPPKWGGYTTYTVVAGKSMEPAFHTGDLVVLRRSNHYGKGDVVTYSVPEDPYRSFNVVHRIVDELPDGRFVVKGDNRDAADPWLIRNTDIRGKKLVLVAKGGFVLVFLSSPMGFALVFGVLVTAWLWGSPSLSRRR